MNRVNSGPERHSIIINNNRDHNKRRSSDPSDLSASQKLELEPSSQVYLGHFGRGHQKPISFAVHPLAIWRTWMWISVKSRERVRERDREGEENRKMIWIVFADATQQQQQRHTHPRQEAKDWNRIWSWPSCLTASWRHSSGSSLQLSKANRAATAASLLLSLLSLWAPYRCHNQKRYLVANSRIISSAPKCLSLGRLQVDLRLPGNQHVQHCQLPTCNFKLPTQTRVPLTAASADCCLLPDGNYEYVLPQMKQLRSEKLNKTDAEKESKRERERGKEMKRKRVLAYSIMTIKKL